VGAQIIFNWGDNMKKAIIGVLAIIFLFFLGLYVNQTREEGKVEEYSRTEFLMDTVVMVQIFTDDQREAQRAADKMFTVMADLEKKFNRHLEGSEVAAINSRAGQVPVDVSAATFALIERALNYSQLTSSAFDITVAPLLDLWGFADEEQHIPAAEELEQALAFVDCTEVVLDRQAQTVFLPRPGMALDLGGIAKGYIVDQGAEVLQEAGIKSALIDAGGDIRVIGFKADQTPWRIGIKHPRQNSRLAAVLPLVDSSVATSGDYERFFEGDGVRYHHLLNPQTGRPARGLSSVTIVASEAADADALSTAIFILGAEEGRDLLESLEGVEGILITDTEEIYISSGLKGQVEQQ
jgi:thiamine biosynthesis lipoprotein